MSILLDTNAWIWAVEDPDRLPERARALLDDPAGYPLGLSAISPWEVAKKASLGKLSLTIPLEQWMSRALNPGSIAVLPLTPAIALESCRLPGEFHRDPADQIIVATARVHDMELVTGDRRLRQYTFVRSVWD